MRRFATLLAASLLVAGFAGSTPALAEATEAVRCDDMLVELAAKQKVLEDLRAAVTKGEADRGAMVKKIEDLSAQIFAGKVSGHDTRALEAERTALRDELKDLEALAAVVKSQLHTLEADVDQAERSYIACVEASIS